ncbi:hypothetical protein ACHAXA_001061 [Cyclostephanos tholiformis]|jgi:hypothetical protein|uniref:XPA C-terminal domain-containing protein n=1 Tax=Cyclostephanos tholiformis TaxID=382380 RepID=A0ABD3R8H7_9STRA
MALTEEQLKRMEENRKRALEIKRKKEQENLQKEKNVATWDSTSVFDAGGFVGKLAEKMESQSKRIRLDAGSNDMIGHNKSGFEGENAKSKTSFVNRGGELIDGVSGDDSLEDFEQDASPYISQTEAQRMYCLPLGTLAICSYIEKDNPRKSGWSKMKLYLRSEVRQRARKRFGGMDGLIKEREKRKQNRFEKDMKEMKDVFR